MTYDLRFLIWPPAMVAGETKAGRGSQIIASDWHAFP
jgi:hypothetical protein